ncbi:MAG: chorismate synthase, partial [Anaerohalosphaera sp.]|nr:chorismate synthase [Anaerohalosphaera sp.]
MLGCHIGRCFQVTVAGGSYQDGLTAVLQGHPPGMSITEQEVYGDLLLRKPGADELSSPRKEPDLPIIYTGLNAADTIEGAGNKNHTNGTPMTILIPNLDRHFIHIKQYQDTNRTPRPGHASYASFIKYGPDDDAIGAGIFSGRYTSTIVAAGYVAKKVLKKLGIEVFSYIKEAAGVQCPDIDSAKAMEYTEAYKKMRCDYDPFYQQVYVSGRVNPEMRFLEKMTVFAQIENEIDAIRDMAPKIVPQEIIDKYGVHHILCCPDIDAANAMVEACNNITKTGDSSGGIVEVVVKGAPVGLGEPVFNKLDAELGRMLGIGAVKGVEVGAGFAVKDMTGIQSNDQLHSEDGKVVFDSNNAGGITGGLASGQDIIVRLAVKPTPT